MEFALRAAVPARDSGLLTGLLTVFVVSCFCAPTVWRLAADYFKQLFRSKREGFTYERTFGERLVLIAGLVQTVVYEGVLLFSVNAADSLPALIRIVGLCAALLVLQLAAYRLVGYAFSTADDTRLWQSAFLITQASLGYMLAIPAFAAVFYPRAAAAWFSVGAVIFGLFRIPLYISEFRIFKTDNLSIFYFFLYLCSLEIVPLLTLWQISAAI